VKPALAWSRARQAVALLGEPFSRFSIADPAARASAHLTYCQVAFTLAFRKVPLPSEMGRIDLFSAAAASANAAGKPILAELILSIAEHERDYSNERLQSLVRLANSLARRRADIEPWLRVELQSRAAQWLQMLEDLMDRVPDLLLLQILPELYALFAPLEAESRAARLREKGVHTLMRRGSFAEALEILGRIPGADPKLLAECREGLGEFEAAAAGYLEAGRPQDALRCYRSIPDFDKALGLLDAVGNHPARESLLWVRRMRDLAAQRPPDFAKALLPPEKKLLEAVLESALGVTRKKAAAKRAPAAKKKPAAPKKSVVVRKPLAPIRPRRDPEKFF
jgi:hypothetical protein